MHSSRSESNHRWQHSERTSRQWDEPNKRRDKWPESHWDSHHQYHRDEPGSSERTSRNMDGDSPQRRYSRDSLSREWDRGSPDRRRVSSPVWDGYEAKRPRYTADYTDHEYRQRRESPRRLSPDSFSNDQKGSDFKFAASHDDDFRYRRSPPDSWNRHPQDAYRKRSNDFPGSYKDKDDQKRRQNSSQERRWSPDRSAKNKFKDKEQKDSPPAAESGQQKHRAGFSMNRSSRQALQNDDAMKSNEQKSSTGFQRFLEVLNKGVNVNDLTKIVSQISGQQVSPNRLEKTVDQTRKKQNQEQRGWGERSRTLVAVKPQQRTLSPSRSPVEKKPPKTDGRTRIASSPSVVEKVLTPEEEQKQRQMQCVLKAIGLDLGFEELGQMSSRIQERLYGKRDEAYLTNERSTRQAFAPKRRSRSWSSSRSSFSPPTRSSDTKEDLSSQRDEVEQHPPQNPPQHPSQHPPQHPPQLRLPPHPPQHPLQNPLSQHPFPQHPPPQTGDYSKFRYEDSSHRSPAVLHVSSPNSSYVATQPPPASPIPTYQPNNWSEFLYPPPSPVPPPVPPPITPPVRPALFLPPFSGVPVGLPVAPPSNFPPPLDQTGRFFPPPINFPPFPPPALNTLQTLNKTQTVKAKPQARPRCLQVIK